MSLGELIDRRADLKAEKAANEAFTKQIEEEIKATERQIMAEMLQNNLVIAAGSKARVVIKEDLQPNVRDWAALHAYIKDNDAFYLLQKRVSATAFREALSAHMEIPGVEGVPVKSLSITAI